MKDSTRELSYLQLWSFEKVENILKSFQFHTAQFKNGFDYPPKRQSAGRQVNQSSRSTYFVTVHKRNAISHNQFPLSILK